MVCGDMLFSSRYEPSIHYKSLTELLRIQSGKWYDKQYETNGKRGREREKSLRAELRLCHHTIEVCLLHNYI
jgi:hypothetical protein